jgi:hypothetical protein
VNLRQPNTIVIGGEQSKTPLEKKLPSPQFMATQGVLGWVLAVDKKQQLLKTDPVSTTPHQPGCHEKRVH